MIEEKEDLIAKQILIKTEIIDKNYNKSLFFSFCMSRKPVGGDDLSNWTIDELKCVINDFIDERNKKNRLEIEKLKEKQTTKSLAESLQLNMEEIRNQRKDQYNKNLNDKEICCRILPKSIFNDKIIKVEVKNPKPVETGYFRPNYITYEIITKIEKGNKGYLNKNESDGSVAVNINIPTYNYQNQNEFLVIRRYSDFVIYRQILSKTFPRLIIPPLPSKKIGGRRFEIDFIEKRMHFLNKFIENVMNNETFKAAEATVAFLTIIDRLQFDSKMKELSSIPPVQFIDETKTLNGKIYISLDNEANEKYFVNIKNYFKLQTQILNHLNENLRDYYKSIITADESLTEIQKDFELLHLLNSKVQMKEDIIKSYEIFGKFFKNWRRNMMNQNEIIKKYVKDFFKYIKMEGESYQELIDSRENIKYYFEKNLEKLQKKKDKLWTNGDLSKWEITEGLESIDRLMLLNDKDYACSKMCTVETKTLENERKILGHANRSNLDELKKLLNTYCVMYTENIKKFAESLSPTITDSLNIWTSVASCFNQE